MLSILAGFMIAVGGIVYLSVGGIGGALLFAVGLMTVCYYKLELFTGKIGLLPTGEITGKKLLEIWIGNFIGSFMAAGLMVGTPKYDALRSGAAAIVKTRLANGHIANLVLGIFCGLLMYIAVNGYAMFGNIVCVYVPVAVFILAGFNHCVADMFYLHMAGAAIEDYIVLVPTTFGNVIGGCLLPTFKTLQDRVG